MKRKYCEICQRPERACVCSFITPINNRTHVIVLQHPSEVKQTKGTVTLLSHSLEHCAVFVGEEFSDNAQLQALLKRFKNNVYLLYPSENSLDMSNEAVQVELSNIKTPKCIILLDGTWKKAYRLFMMNPFLHKLQHLTLPDGLEAEYKIRKTQKSGALSSLEACCYALVFLDEPKHTLNIYQPLLKNFKAFNEFQLSFLPKK